MKCTPDVLFCAPDGTYQQSDRFDPAGLNPQRLIRDRWCPSGHRFV